MSRFLTSTFVIALICCFSQHTKAQERLNDFEIWAKLAVEGDVGERWKLGLEQQIRFDENSTEVKNFFTEFALNYKISSHFALLGRARFFTRNDNRGADQGFKNYFRYQLGFRIKHEAGQFRFNHRLLYQRRDRFNLTPEEGDVILKYARYRLKTTYKIKNWKYDPIFTGEYFLAFENPVENIPDGMRLGIGTERSYEGFGKLGLFYRYEWTINYPFPEGNFILAFAYTYEF
jgi:hypothetical protein